MEDKEFIYRLNEDEIETLLSESSVDFPMPTLDSLLWKQLEDGSYVMDEKAKQRIMRTLEKNPYYSDMDIEDVRVIGSITSNLYTDDTDIDVHIVLKAPLGGDINDEVKEWSRDAMKYIGDHPIELYVQDNPSQDMLSVGVYSITQDKWLKEPSFVDSDYNPYEVFKNVLSKVEELAKVADAHLGELKRDVIDYSLVVDAYKRLDDKGKESLKAFIDEKLNEIEKDIETLLKDKKEWIEYRRSTPATTDPELAFKDMEVVKQWNDVNAVFKFINRYGYLKVVSELEKIAKGKDLDSKDVEKISNVLDVPKKEGGTK